MLNVYRASAGSGKTYRLTYEYIKMLLGYRNYDKLGGDGHYNFYKNYVNSHRRILAVTFTNKATDEMKRRIIEELEILARDVHRSAYCDDLCVAFDCGATVLQQNAEVALNQILKDFSYFNISTIDSFFQQVLRAFTREIGLQGGYEVEMDSEHVTQLAIDSMFAELEDREDLLEWLLQYAKENILNEGSWNIQGGANIPILAKQLMQDEYKKNSKSLSGFSLNDYKKYIETLKQLQSDYLLRLTDKAKAVGASLQAQSVSTDVIGSNFGKALYYFENLTEPKIDKKKVEALLKYRDAAGKCFPKSNLKKVPYSAEELYNIVAGDMEELIAMLEGEQYREFCSVAVSLEYIYALGVLSTLDVHIRDYERAHNTILLSRTPDILKGLISDNDAPFIYERVGSRIAHYMIDEFQDTSRVQWDNFAPLIHDSLASNNDNLIVGDVKQSIYRWRNSDWNLLHKELGKIRSCTDMTTTRDTNWRSCANIIAFNNAFFRNASSLLCGELNERIKSLPASEQFKPLIDDIYSTAPQYISPKNVEKSGHVSVNVFSVDKKDEFIRQADSRIGTLLKQLFEKGYRQRDILFLVRSNSECKHLVEWLLSLSVEYDGVLRDIRVISNESLLVTNAPPVKLILGILRYLLNPSFSINKLILNYQYELIKNDNESEALSRYFNRLDDDEVMDAELKAFIERISLMPLYEMCENIIHHFKLSSLTTYVAYIEAFQDVVIEYCRSHPADLYSFLSWWKKKEDSVTVKLPENLDAVSVMTIHKSKGLESPVVIIPYASWALSSETNSLTPNLRWLKPDRAPFNTIPVLPIAHKSKLADTIYAKDFYEELHNEYIDSLNVAYVAFTRAKQELYVFTSVSQKEKSDSSALRISDMGELIRQSLCTDVSSQGEVCEMMKFSSHLSSVENELVFDVGDDWQAICDDKPQVMMTDVVYSVSPPQQDKLRLKQKSRSRDGELLRAQGVVLHEMLAEIVTVDDVSSVVQRYVREGVVREKQAMQVRDTLLRIINHPDRRRWFSKDVRVVVETDILKAGEKINRPDRIVIDGDKVTVIDYKFGQREVKAYSDKVRLYMSLMREMGYSHVEGCIWYVMKDKLVPVE